MTKRPLTAGGAALAGALALLELGLALVPLAPAAAQNANDKVLVIFGSDRCPAGTICVRKGESERFRIPKELRDSTPSANNQTWASRQKSLSGVGAAGPGSCSTAGAGGWTGCWAKEMRDNKATRAAVTQQASSAPN